MRSQTVEQVSRAELVDGSVISLRRLNSGDADDVVRLYESLTDDECYFRFFTMHPAQLQRYARSITERSNDQYCLGAFDSEKLLGVANYVACKTPGDAEVAVVVAHNRAQPPRHCPRRPSRPAATPICARPPASSQLPLGGWASDIKLGALSLELAREILRDPDQWPGDLAQRAAEKIGTRLASKASTLAATAQADAWFT